MPGELKKELTPALRDAARNPGGLAAAGRDDEDAAGLAVIARDLGHRLARAAAEGAREAGRIPHRGLQGAEQRPCIGRLAHEPREVEVALVDADLLVALDEAPDHVPDRA